MVVFSLLPLFVEAKKWYQTIPLAMLPGTPSPILQMI